MHSWPCWSCLICQLQRNTWEKLDTFMVLRQMICIDTYLTHSPSSRQLCWGVYNAGFYLVIAGSIISHCEKIYLFIVNKEGSRQSLMCASGLWLSLQKHGCSCVLPASQVDRASFLYILLQLSCDVISFCLSNWIKLLMSDRSCIP